MSPRPAPTIDTARALRRLTSTATGLQAPACSGNLAIHQSLIPPQFSTPHHGPGRHPVTPAHLISRDPSRLTITKDRDGRGAAPWSCPVLTGAGASCSLWRRTARPGTVPPAQPASAASDYSDDGSTPLVIANPAVLQRGGRVTILPRRTVVPHCESHPVVKPPLA